MKPCEHPAWDESLRDARRQWPGLPEWAFALVNDAPFPSIVEIVRMDAPLVALLARAFMLLKESNEAKEEMYTGTQHLAVATLRMQGHEVPDRALDADLDRFRRQTGEVPSA